jgi:hypothetical protein
MLDESALLFLFRLRIVNATSQQCDTDSEEDRKCNALHKLPRSYLKLRAADNALFDRTVPVPGRTPGKEIRPRSPPGARKAPVELRPILSHPVLHGHVRPIVVPLNECFSRVTKSKSNETTNSGSAIKFGGVRLKV